MSISYTEHARENLGYYDIPERDVERVLKNAEKVFLDLKTVITVFPTSKTEKMVERRTAKGRWLEI